MMTFISKVNNKRLEGDICKSKADKAFLPGVYQELSQKKKKKRVTIENSQSLCIGKS